MQTLNRIDRPTAGKQHDMVDYDDNAQTYTETVPTGSKTALELRRSIATSVFRLGLDLARECGMTKEQEGRIDTEDTLAKVEGILFQDLTEKIEVLWESPMDVDGTPSEWWKAEDLRAILEVFARWRESDAEDYIYGLYLGMLGQHRSMSEVEILEFMGMGFEEKEAIELEVLDKTKQGSVLYRIQNGCYAIKNSLGIIAGLGASEAMESWHGERGK